MPVTLKLRTVEVPCAKCGADIGENCVGTQGFHKVRHDYCRDLIKKSTGNSDSARWWRWRITKAGVPRVNKPCGTVPAYKRHIAKKEEPCKQCTAAMKKHWREESAARIAAGTK